MNKVKDFQERVEKVLEKYEFDEVFADAGEFSNGVFHAIAKIRYRGGTVDKIYSGNYNSDSGAVNCLEKFNDWFFDNRNRLANIEDKEIKVEKYNRDIELVHKGMDKVIVQIEEKKLSKDGNKLIKTFMNLEIDNEKILMRSDVPNNDELSHEYKRGYFVRNLAYIEDAVGENIRNYFPRYYDTPGNLKFFINGDSITANNQGFMTINGVQTSIKIKGYTDVYKFYVDVIDEPSNEVDELKKGIINEVERYLESIKNAKAGDFIEPVNTDAYMKVNQLNRKLMELEYQKSLNLKIARNREVGNEKTN